MHISNDRQSNFSALIILAVVLACVLLGFNAKSYAARYRAKPLQPIIQKIVIVGNRKIEASAIRAQIGSKVGDRVNRKQIRQDIEHIFATGFFIDIEVGEKIINGTAILTYYVKEKPTISKIVFEGNDAVDTSDLKSAIDLKAYEILDMAKVRTAVKKLQQLYENKGFFLAKVTAEATPGKDNTATLTFHIVENRKVKVAKIRFIGNKHISSNELRNVMQTKVGGFFSFISGSGSFKQDTFNRDIQLLYYLVYYNKGYIQAHIDRPQVYVTPDKKYIYITIRVHEGPKFRVGEVNFTGDLLFPDRELYKSIHTKSGHVFVYQTLQQDLRALQAKYGDLGYAYANIIPQTRARVKQRRVDITFNIDKGPKVYIGKINIIGNTKTRDKVIRREMRIYEGELYNETKRRESLANIKRLGYFSSVTFDTHTPPGHPNIMDIDVHVKERNTGQIQLGAGYSSFGGFLLNGQIQQINLFGLGDTLGLSVNLSSYEKIFDFSFTNPYFMDTHWLLGTHIFYTDMYYLEYIDNERGVGFTVGHPLAQYLRGTIGYKVERTNIQLTSSGDPTLFPTSTTNGIASILTAGLAYDTRNDRFEPSRGMYDSLNVEYSGLGGDLFYTKAIANARYFHPLPVYKQIIWRNNLVYGIITSDKSGEPPPFNQLFLLGGPNTLRGFDWFTIGRKKFSQVAFDQLAGSPNAYLLAFKPFGGTQELYYNLEFEFPLIPEAAVKGVVFYDVGYADDSLILSEFRSDWGFGFRWFSPIGPLRFEFGLPFDRQAIYGEKPVDFQFAIGSPF